MTDQCLPWQQTQWHQLGELLDTLRLPHGLLFCGPGEIGKRQFALRFARRLLCTAPIEGNPCQRCKSCLLLNAGSHPDFLLVEPEARGKAIKVDQIRRLGEFTTKTAAMSGRRVVVVAPAEAMNISAANAFLKTLEEPGEGVVLLLVAHQPGKLLPTVRSRCRILPFPLPDRQQVSRWLVAEGVDEGAVEDVMALSGGRPLRARRLLEHGAREQLNQFRETVEAVAGRRLSPLDGAKVLQGVDREDAVEWFQYLVYTHLKAVAMENQGGAGRLLFRFLDRLNSAGQRLTSSANPNPQLVWEEVLMDWASVIDLQHKKSGT